MDGSLWLPTATSEIVRWAPVSNFSHDGTVNSTALKNLKKPKQHATCSMLASLSQDSLHTLNS